MARIQGDGSGNVLNGTTGNDLIFGGGGADTLNGSSGSDALYGYGTGASPANTPITATLIASGLQSPVFMTQAPDGTDRAFVIEQNTGQIKIVDLATGAVSATPFLDIDGLGTGSEQGLLGLAFHPNYLQNGLFYVNYTDSANATNVVEYQVSSTDPNVANPSSARTLLTIQRPFENHNGGWLGFGPDGFLYITSGDGGTEGDSANHAQNINGLLGKILRIDVDTTSGSLPYGIPASNPFVGIAGADEIWALGLRNPWRASFDMFLGDMWIGDVGDGMREEIDFQPFGAPGGRNYGWNILEGTFVFRPGEPTTGFTPPIYEYDHATGLAVTGGYVYRGAAAGFAGEYFFGDFYGDFATAKIWSIIEENGTLSRVVERTAAITPNAGDVDQLASFGQDRFGRIYTVGLDGEIHRLDFPDDRSDAGNLFNGGAGNDRLFGGSGLDVASYSAASGSATWSYNADGTWSVTTAADGTDQLSGIDIAQFTDRQVRLWRLEGEDLAGDFNGDGRDDTLLRNSAGALVSWESSATGSVGNERVLGALPFSYSIIGVGDFNGSGTDDILLREEISGALVMWSMNGTSSAGGALPLPLAWHMEAVADFNGDGTDDLLLRNANTDVLLVWQVGNFSVTGGGAVGQVTGTWRLLGTGDFNGDNKDDLLWYDGASNVISVWQMDGSTGSGLGSLGTLDASWSVQGIADFNGDGRDDILWRHTSGALSQWQMNGGTVTNSSVFASLPPELTIQNVGAYNSGATADILLRNAATNDVVLWSMNGTTVTDTQVLRTPISDWFVV